MTATVDPTHVEFAATYIRKNKGVSFPELQRLMEREFQMDTKGGHCIEIRHNVILWAGMSEEFLHLVFAIGALGDIDLHPTQVLVYHIDGCLLKFPLARSVPKKGYKDPHWIPVTFSPKEKGRKPVGVWS